jgi:hypothetical protein
MARVGALRHRVRAPDCANSPELNDESREIWGWRVPHLTESAFPLSEIGLRSLTACPLRVVAHRHRAGQPTVVSVAGGTPTVEKPRGRGSNSPCRWSGPVYRADPYRKPLVLVCEPLD